MGYSFAAGTTDGPGAFNFKQGEAQLDKIDLYFLEYKSMYTIGLVLCCLKPLSTIFQLYRSGCNIGLTDVLSIHFK